MHYRERTDSSYCLFGCTDVKQSVASLRKLAHESAVHICRPWPAAGSLNHTVCVFLLLCFGAVLVMSAQVLYYVCSLICLVCVMNRVCCSGMVVYSAPGLKRKFNVPQVYSLIN